MPAFWFLEWVVQRQEAGRRLPGRSIHAKIKNDQNVKKREHAAAEMTSAGSRQTSLQETEAEKKGNSMGWGNEANPENHPDMEDIRGALKDYYGTAMQEFPMAVLDLARVDTMSDEEVLREARQAGLI